MSDEDFVYSQTTQKFSCGCLFQLFLYTALLQCKDLLFVILIIPHDVLFGI